MPKYQIQKEFKGGVQSRRKIKLKLKRWPEVSRENESMNWWSSEALDRWDYIGTEIARKTSTDLGKCEHVHTDLVLKKNTQKLKKKRDLIRIDDGLGCRHEELGLFPTDQ